MSNAPAPTYNRFDTPEARLAALETMDPKDTVFVACGKCSGKGYIQGFGHVLEGVCFDCSGARGTRRTVAREKANAKAMIRRFAKVEAEAAARVAEAESKRAAWGAANPEVVAELAAYDGPEFGFMADMVFTFKAKGCLSEAQAAGVLKGAKMRAERAAADAVAEPVPAGRVVVTGEVVKLDTRTNAYGTTYKMLVRDDRGFRVWGTEPRGLDPEKGDRVTFTATLEPSADDVHFGFYSRPTKAEVLEAVAA